MIFIDIHWQGFSKNWRMSFRFVLSPSGNYRELTVVDYKFISFNGDFFYFSNKSHYFFIIIEKNQI